MGLSADLGLSDSDPDSSNEVDPKNAFGAQFFGTGLSDVSD